MRGVITFVILLIVISLAFQTSVSAHPIDEIGDVRVYDQKQKLELEDNKTRLTIDLTFYAIEKLKVWESIDTNRDEKLEQSEKDVWMKKGQDASWLTVNGRKYDFNAVNLTFPEYHDFYSTKPAPVSIQFASDYVPKIGDRISYHYRGKDRKLDEIEFSATGDSNIGIDSFEKVSPEEVSFVLKHGAGQGEVLGLNAKSRVNIFLNKYVKVDNIPTSVKIAALFIAFVLGLLHAMTPGHGKAILAGYLIGERGNVWHAVQLGLIITVTHTFSVFVLGLAALFLTHVLVTSVVVKWLNLTSGVLIILFGLYLIVVRSKKLFKKHELIGVGGLDHDHPHSHDHVHDNPHHHEKEIAITWKNLVPLGISGGIVPCIDALAILVVAVSLQKILFGIGLLIMFSLGLASALIFGGVVLVVAKNKAMKRMNSLGKFEKYISLASAFVVTLLGVLLVVKSPL